MEEGTPVLKLRANFRAAQGGRKARGDGIHRRDHRNRALAWSLPGGRQNRSLQDGCYGRDPCVISTSLYLFFSCAIVEEKIIKFFAELLDRNETTHDVRTRCVAVNRLSFSLSLCLLRFFCGTARDRNFHRRSRITTLRGEDLERGERQVCCKFHRATCRALSVSSKARQGPAFSVLNAPLQLPAIFEVSMPCNEVHCAGCETRRPHEARTFHPRDSPRIPSPRLASSRLVSSRRASRVHLGQP